MMCQPSWVGMDKTKFIKILCFHYSKASYERSEWCGVCEQCSRFCSSVILSTCGSNRELPRIRVCDAGAVFVLGILHTLYCQKGWWTCVLAELRKRQDGQLLEEIHYRWHLKLSIQVHTLLQHNQLHLQMIRRSHYIDSLNWRFSESTFCFLPSIAVFTEMRKV